MKIIVLNKTAYKDSDSIITALKEDGLFSFKVRGSQSPTNPFQWLNNPLTVAEVEFAGPQTYKYPILKRATLLLSPMTNEQTFSDLMAINMVSEITNKMLEDEEKHLLYNDIINFIDNYTKKDADVLTMLLIYLAKATKVAGFELEVNKCVHCGSKSNIVAFSFEEGGFICKHCLQEDINRDLTPSQMKLVRFVFSAPDFSYKVSENITENDKKTLLFKMNTFINDIIGTNIESINLILNN